MPRVCVVCSSETDLSLPVAGSPVTAWHTHDCIAHFVLFSQSKWLDLFHNCIGHNININYNSHFYANQTTTGQQPRARIHTWNQSPIYKMIEKYNWNNSSQSSRIEKKGEKSLTERNANAQLNWSDVKWNMLHEQRMSAERITTK